MPQLASMLLTESCFLAVPQGRLSEEKETKKLRPARGGTGGAGGGEAAGVGGGGAGWHAAPQVSVLVLLY